MTPQNHPHTGELPAQKMERTDFLLVTCMVLAGFVLILNETLLGVALPVLMHELNISASTAQWSTTAFMLTMAVITPASGFMLARFSTRQVFSTAMAVFFIGTAIAGFAPNFNFLILGRIFQALGTGTMMPLLMTTVMRVVPIHQRGQAMGIISMVISAAPALGPTVSGLILAHASWRWLFYAVLPIGLLALLAALKLAPHDVPPAQDEKLDILSLILSTIGFGGLVWGFSTLGGGHGADAHTQPVINPWVALIVALLALTIFIFRQLSLQKKGFAFLDLRVFQSRTFTLTILLSTISFGLMIGTAVLIPLYAASVLGVGALETGLMLLPGGATMAILSPYVGKLADKHPARLLVLPGTIFLCIATWMMSLFSVGTPIWFVIAANMLMSLALPFISTPMMSVGLGSLPQSLYSYGSATMGAIQQVGGAAATAGFVAIMSAVAAGTSGSSVAEASAAGFHVALLVGAVFSMLAIVVAVFLPKKRAAE